MWTWTNLHMISIWNLLLLLRRHQRWMKAQIDLTVHDRILTWTLSTINYLKVHVIQLFYIPAITLCFLICSLCCVRVGLFPLIFCGISVSSYVNSFFELFQSSFWEEETQNTLSLCVISTYHIYRTRLRLWFGWAQIS